MHALGRGGREPGPASQGRPATTGRAQTNFIGGVRSAAQRLPDEMVVVMAHRDSSTPPGANDDGSGTATMLAIAEAAWGQRLKPSGR